MLIIDFTCKSQLIAQERKTFTISGFIESAESGERIVNANIYESLSQKGAISNNYGFFSLKTNNKFVQLLISHVSHQDTTIVFELRQDTVINISLRGYQSLEEVEVVANASLSSFNETRMSTVSLSQEVLEKTPILFGESDALRVVQFLPGVQSGGEGVGGLFVRGGSPDQNLILLDGVPVYNVNHLFGFFSVFNSDAIRNLTFTKGAFPARFSGRLSSVLEIDMKEGNLKESEGKVSVGLISSKFSYSLPIKKDKTSLSISARRTYIDLLIAPIVAAENTDNETNDFGYYFYDLNAKFQHVFSNTSKLFVSLYTGQDTFYFRNNFDESNVFFNSGTDRRSNSSADIGWGNLTSSVRWNKLWSPNLFSNTSLYYTEYGFGLDFNSSDRSRVITSGRVTEQNSNSNRLFSRSQITEFGLKSDFNYTISSNSDLGYGAQLISQRFQPQRTSFNSNQDDEILSDRTISPGDDIQSYQAVSYIELNTAFNEKNRLTIGLNTSIYSADGTNYSSLEPRLSYRYAISDDKAWKASITRMQQYIHLLTNSGFALPTDMWVPSTNRVKPQVAWQYALGYSQRFKGNYELNVDVYYKDLSNLIELAEGSNFQASEVNWDEQLALGGVGQSRGIELLFSKISGATTGWISYTLSRNDRQFDDLNRGRAFPFKYDRRHNFAMVVQRKINERIDISGSWIFLTGIAATVAEGQFLSVNPDGFRGNGSLRLDNLPLFSGRNQYRLPNEHRLDISINFQKQKKRGLRTWNLSLYNAYSRANPFALLPDGDFEYSLISLFPILPSFTYSFEF
jgi:hypothetical protein